MPLKLESTRKIHLIISYLGVENLSFSKSQPKVKVSEFKLVLGKKIPSPHFMTQ